MTLRTGMSTLIATLRGMTDAGLEDYTLTGVNYWSDDEVQRVLDRHQTQVIRDQLTPVQEYDTGGTVYYKRYYSHFGNYEQTTGGTAIFWVQNAAGSVIGTAGYTPDYAAGLVTFGSNTGGSTYYVTGYSYDLDASAAELWRIKAAHAAKLFDVSTDAGRLARSQLMTHYFQMAERYSRNAPVRSALMERSDT